MKKPRSHQWYGWRKDHPDFRDYKYGPLLRLSKPLAAYPDQVDLRSVMPPVVDQGQAGSCTGNSSVALPEHNMLANSQPLTLLSRLFAYYNGRVLEGGQDGDNGAEIRDVVSAMAQTGICPETDWPYDITQVTTKPPDQAYTDAANERVTMYYRLESLDDMQHCLADGFPFVFGFTVYDSFESPEMAAGGVLALPGPNESVCGGHAVCLRGDTRIPLANGKDELLCVLADSKDPFWVYSISKKGRIVPGKATARRTNPKAQLVEVGLDNGQSIICTPDHRIMLRDGTYQEATALRCGDSLMPLYRQLSTDPEMFGYEKVYHPGSSTWQFTHRAFGFPKRGMVLHHKDFNKRNNEPSNLQLMSPHEHLKLHSEITHSRNRTEESRECSRRTMTANWANPEWKARALIRAKNNGTKIGRRLASEGRNGFQAFDRIRLLKLTRANGKRNWPNLQTPEAQARAHEAWTRRFATDPSFQKSVVKRAINNLKAYNEKVASGVIGLSQKQLRARQANVKIAQAKRLGLNHKVVFVRSAGVGAVYDLSVERWHNFAVSAGVFVHNCAVGYDNTAQTILVRNSWGTDWGLPDKPGHFTMPFAYITNSDLAQDFWTIRQ